MIIHKSNTFYIFKNTKVIFAKNKNSLLFLIILMKKFLEKGGKVEKVKPHITNQMLEKWKF